MTYFVIDELGHIVARRPDEKSAHQTAVEFTDNPRLRGRFDSLSLEEYYRREPEFQRKQNEHSSKNINKTNQDSWGFLQLEQHQ